MSERDAADAFVPGGRMAEISTDVELVSPIMPYTPTTTTLTRGMCAAAMSNTAFVIQLETAAVKYSGARPCSSRLNC